MKVLNILKRVQNNLLVLLLLSLIVFILLHLFLPLSLVSTISDDFNKISISIAALITAYFGSSYFREELSRKKSLEFYKRKYPPEQYGRSYKFIESVKTPGAIFLLDLESSLKHHIWNMKTMYDMGWQIYLPAERLSDKVFLSYLMGDPIRTRGDLGE